MKRHVDEPGDLRQTIAIALLLERIEEVEPGSGPAREPGITRGWPAYEVPDLTGGLRGFAAFALASTALLACAAPRGAIECVDDTSCGLAADGRCLVNPATGNQFCAYPDGTCPEGMRWSDYDVEEGISGACVAGPDAGAPDAALDAATDAVDAAPTQAAFAIGAVSEWRISGSPANMTATNWVRVANVGEAPLDLSTGAVTSVSFGDARFAGNATWVAVPTILAPDRSAGSLSAAAAQVIVASGLMSEPAQDSANDILQLRVTMMPPAGQWLGVDIEISVQIANARATIPTRVILSASGTPTGTPVAGQRIMSAPVP